MWRSLRLIVVSAVCWLLSDSVLAQLCTSDYRAERSDDGSAVLCATCPPTRSVKKDHLWQCSLECTERQDGDCAGGFNYRAAEHLCELFREQQGRFAVVPNCNYYKKISRNGVDTEDSCAILMQQKVDWTAFFDRSWAEFQCSFGRPDGNFWLGLDALHRLTKDGRYKLRLEMQSYDSEKWFVVEYSSFAVGSEATGYRLTATGFSGNVSNNAMVGHNGQKFTTFDRDNDQRAGGNLATSYSGGWWFNTGGMYVPTGNKGVKFKYGHLADSSDRRLKTNRMWLICK